MSVFRVATRRRSRAAVAVSESGPRASESLTTGNLNAQCYFQCSACSGLFASKQAVQSHITLKKRHLRLARAAAAAAGPGAALAAARGGRRPGGAEDPHATLAEPGFTRLTIGITGTGRILWPGMGSAPAQSARSWRDSPASAADWPGPGPDRDSCPGAAGDSDPESPDECSRGGVCGGALGDDGGEEAGDHSVR
jgi:hypothetical protein